MSDRLTLTRAFEGAGLKSADAERIATEIYDAIHDNVATKTDLQNEIAAVRADLRETEQRLERRIDQVVVRLGALAVVIAGLLFAALQRWPPH